MIMVKKITMMQQRSTEQCSTVDSRRRLTNFKMLLSHSMSAVLRQWNQVLKLPSGTCQKFVDNDVKINNIFGFSTL